MGKIHFIGNAHIDPVWLWRWQDGYEGNYNPYITDGTHPTQEGSEMIARLLVREIRL